MQPRLWHSHGSRVLAAILLQLLVACATPATRQSAVPPLVTVTISPIAQPTTPPAPGTATPSPTPTFASPTPSPLPTLSEAEREAYLVQLATTNGGCDLPCFWGLEPGTTALLAAEDLLTRLTGKPLGECQYSDPKTCHTSGLNVLERDIVFSMVILDDDGIVQAIKFDVQNVHTLEQISPGTPSPFADDWRYYSLDRILTTHGMPSQVMIRLRSPGGDADSTPLYGLFVIYDPLGFSVVYTGPTIYGDLFQVCPAFSEIELIHIYSTSVDSDISLYDLTTSDETLEYLKPLQEAAGMSTQAFYEAFKEPASQACLETPLDIWPP